MFPSNSVLFCGLIISVVDCRQSGCSYNVESSFVETDLYYRCVILQGNPSESKTMTQIHVKYGGGGKKTF